MAGNGVEIRAEGLACRRGERLLFEGLSLAAAPGQFVEIAGTNGAGKTSLLRILAGLLAAEAGTVAFARGGKPLGGDDDPPAALLHYLGHQDALKAQMTARENLGFAAAWFGAARRPEEALERLNLNRQADLPVGYLSAGQKRRLALARCWMAGRPLWLLDEPTASLDGAGKMLVGALIETHLAEGGTAIAATHEAILGDATRVPVG